MEWYSFEQEESDSGEVEESNDSSGAKGIEPLDVDMEFNSPNNFYTKGRTFNSEQRLQ